MTENSEFLRIGGLVLSEGRGLFLFIGLVMGFLVSGLLQDFGFYLRKNNFAGCEVIKVGSKTWLSASQQCADIIGSMLKRGVPHDG